MVQKVLPPIFDYFGHLLDLCSPDVHLTDGSGGQQHVEHMIYLCYLRTVRQPVLPRWPGTEKQLRTEQRRSHRGTLGRKGFTLQIPGLRLYKKSQADLPSPFSIHV